MNPKQFLEDSKARTDLAYGSRTHFTISYGESAREAVDLLFLRIFIRHNPLVFLCYFLFMAAIGLMAGGKLWGLQQKTFYLRTLFSYSWIQVVSGSEISSPVG